MISGIAFSAPWLLAALVALPVLWLILRAVPPAPVRQRFPAIGLLVGLRDDDSTSARTPWWLLLLRVLAVAAVIIGLAGPVLNPHRQGVPAPDRPLLVVMDASWASARDWRARQAYLRDRLEEAGRQGRQVGIVTLSQPEPVIWQTADQWLSRLASLQPAPWEPVPWKTGADVVLPEAGPYDTLWLSDGVARADRADLLAALQMRGRVEVAQGDAPLIVLTPPQSRDGAVQVTARRMGPQTGARTVQLRGIGTDPSGIERDLVTQDLTFEEGADSASVSLALPNELRGRLGRFEIAGQQHAGAVSLSADSLRQREVALIAANDNREGLQVLSPLHYLEQALAPSSEVLLGELGTLLPANPDVIILADVAQLAPAEAEALTAWVEDGGMLVRFAGPRLAASDVARRAEDPLLPVRLRAGGRSVGGAMSWGEARHLQRFEEDSPFAGLSIPQDVTVSAQVLAQPGPELADRVIARLEDDTPLVTRKDLGAGQVVLFHVTANVAWSTLPLSGLFVQMLERLAVVSGHAQAEADTLAGTIWQPVAVLDGFGRLSASDDRPGVSGEVLSGSPPGPQTPPGLYRSEARQIARNVIGADADPRPMQWPASVAVVPLTGAAEVPLGGWLLALALVLLCLDVPATLGLSGRLWPTQVALILLMATGWAAPDRAQAQEVPEALAANDVVLAYVKTGDAGVDKTSDEGLRGLSWTLAARTTVEPADPRGIDLERDELSLYPMLYWPVTPDQALPSPAAYARLNTYLRTGGMILFDTRDGDVAGANALAGTLTGTTARLRQLAAPLDIPPLEPIPADHVLTRTFYLLQDFPGRYAGTQVWVEAAPADAEEVEGMPFRNLNDGVTPVIIGGNDWAAGWAVKANGLPSFRVGQGYAGEHQREMAYRFGVNLVMYVLTGNYKSDQVHVPALLERLGQ